MMNTVPPATLNAFRDHGSPRESLSQNVNDSKNNLEKLNDLGINLDEISEQLQADGLEAFVDSFRSLINVLETKCKSISEHL